MENTEAKKDLRNREAFSMEDLPEILPFGRRSLFRMISSGVFPKADKKVGRKKLWRVETIRSWLAAQ